MKTARVLAVCLLSGLVGHTSSALAESKFPDDMKIAAAISHAIAQSGKSEYKDMEVMTTSGSVSGEFVKLAGSVLILKQKSGNINLKHNKERVQYIMVDVNSITGISFATVE